jgi:hypothetical protein
MPRNIRQLVAALEAAGFALARGGTEVRRKFRHPGFGGAIILSGKDEEDAHHYQATEVRNAIRATIR